MEFKFDANQEYQVAAVDAVVNLFEGQPHGRIELTFSLGSGVGTSPNRLDLDEDALLQNLQTTQQVNDLPTDAELQCIESEAETAEGTIAVRFPNFSVEMETGTGKTYVYLRTALELFRHYGWRKFIIVVPSVAVREGVVKTLQITERHFREMFANTPYKFASYDSENLSQVRQFATSGSAEFMVMTIDSFNKASNVIRQTTDRLQGETPIHLVQATRPILILDEPQNMESELRVKALAALNPLFALRYSATHKNPYNVVYKLTPYEAYRQGLVKRIEVAGITKENDANQVFMRLEGVSSQKTSFTARIAVHQLLRTGQVKEKVVTVKPGDRLEAKTSREEYAPFVIEEISVADQCVRFANGTEIKSGESRGADKAAIFREQIRYTVEEHFKKQERLKPLGIKVLSLFFIDRVDNYAKEDGIIREYFREAFNDLRKQRPGWETAEVEKVQAAYFASHKTREGDVIYEDSKSGESERDREAYKLIMQKKEQLLSFDEPVAFIFSHSALREGWDSPNVFQICTLNQSVSEMRKRQEIGRGVRLPVNQKGDRIRDDAVNVLTVVANESYERYVARYQDELDEAYGVESEKPPIRNARARGLAKLRKEFTLKPEFKQLWERIKHKTRYSVEIDSEALLAEVLPKLNAMKISPPKLRVAKAQVEVGGSDDRFSAVLMGDRGRDVAGEKRGIPNLVELMGSLMEHTTPPVRLTRRTLLEVFKRTKIQKAALANPHEFATVTVRILKGVLADHLAKGIQYEKDGTWYDMELLEVEIPGWMDHMIPSRRSVYDHVVWQSQTEKAFAEALDNDDRVKAFIKLPSWFTVRTPVGEYNPDWAIVMEPRDEHGQRRDGPLLYLVRETKDVGLPGTGGSLRDSERRKVHCGEKHFKHALKVDYNVQKEWK